MPRHDPFDNIPTLTQRAEPGFAASDAQSPPWEAEALAPVPAKPAPEPSTPSSISPGSASLPPETVLRAALQAELEQTLQTAVEDAVMRIRERLDAELPAAVARALQRVKQG